MQTLDFTKHASVHLARIALNHIPAPEVSGLARKNARMAKKIVVPFLVHAPKIVTPYTKRLMRPGKARTYAGS